MSELPDAPGEGEPRSRGNLWDVIWLIIIPAAAIFPIVLAVAYVVWDDSARKERIAERRRGP